MLNLIIHHPPATQVPISWNPPSPAAPGLRILSQKFLRRISSLSLQAKLILGESRHLQGYSWQTGDGGFHEILRYTHQHFMIMLHRKTRSGRQDRALKPEKERYFESHHPSPTHNMHPHIMKVTLKKSRSRRQDGVPSPLPQSMGMQWLVPQNPACPPHFFILVADQQVLSDNQSGTQEILLRSR